MLIAEPPSSWPEQRRSGLGRTVIWFKNAELEQIIACDRPRDNVSCYHEKPTIFQLRGDEWIELEGVYDIVCFN